jgi:hypothetical protein
MPKRFIVFGAVYLVLAFSGLLRAQSPDSEDVDTGDDSTNLDPSPVIPQGSQGQPDWDGNSPVFSQRSVTGVESLNLGNSAQTRNFVLPSVDVMSQVATNPGPSSTRGVTGVTYLLGNLDLYHTSSRSSLQLDYTGGGIFTVDGGDHNSPVQALGVADTFRWQRWSLLLADGASYLSQSPFGFGGVGGLYFLGGLPDLGSNGLLGGNLVSLSTAVTPNQTVSTAYVPQLSNATVAQIEYQLSPRSSWTISGSYGLLRFFQPGYIDNSDDLFQTGYNYELSPTTTLGLLYRFEGFRFNSEADGIDVHTAEVVYGRHITGRLSFQVAAGPDYLLISTAGASPTQSVSWAADTSMNVQFSRMSLTASFDHLPTGGSGVFSGAATDQVQGMFQRDLGRAWTASASLGYARNRNLIPAASDLARNEYTYWYTTARVSRRFSEKVTLFLAYEAYLQDGATAVCTAACRSGAVSNEFTMGFNWSLRPAVLP